MSSDFSDVSNPTYHVHSYLFVLINSHTKCSILHVFSNVIFSIVGDKESVLPARGSRDPGELEQVYAHALRIRDCSQCVGHEPGGPHGELLPQRDGQVSVPGELNAGPRLTWIQ